MCCFSLTTFKFKVALRESTNPPAIVQTGDTLPHYPLYPVTSRSPARTAYDGA